MEKRMESMSHEVKPVQKSFCILDKNETTIDRKID